MKKIVVLTSRFPYPLERGDKLRIYHQIKELSKHFEVCLIALCDKTTTTSHIEALSPYAKIHCVELSFFQKIINLLLAFFTDTPLTVGLFYSEKIAKKINKIVADEKPDAIYCQLIRMAKYATPFDLPKVIDYQDAFGENMKKRAEKANFLMRFIYDMEAKRLLRFEEKAYHTFQKHFIIAEADKNFLQFEAKKTIEICQNGIDLSFFQPKKDILPQYDLVFIGNLGYHPNIEAAKFIAQRIVPKLLDTFPDIKVLIAGARPTFALKQLASKNVVIQGWVVDIRDAYAAGKIFVAPLFQGSGQQNKVLETMSMQLPCVTTTMVNNSTRAIENEHLLIANSEEEFCEKIILLLNDKNIYNKLKVNALKFVNENFEWSKTTSILVKTLETLTQKQT